MFDKNKDAIKNRMTLPEAIAAGETSFYKSWWFLFIFVVPLSLIFYPQLYDYFEPYIEAIENKDVRANVQYLSFIAYLIITVVFPFLFFYKLGDHLKKRTKE